MSGAQGCTYRPLQLQDEPLDPFQLASTVHSDGPCPDTPRACTMSLTPAAQHKLHQPSGIPSFSLQTSNTPWVSKAAAAEAQTRDQQVSCVQGAGAKTDSGQPAITQAWWLQGFQDGNIPV